MYLRDFQICLRDHNADLYGKARCTWEPVEMRIRQKIPKLYNFGSVGKVVIEVGPEAKKRPRYRVLLGVGLFHYSNFDINHFLALSQLLRVECTLNIIQTSMIALGQQFGVSTQWLIDELSAIRQEHYGCNPH